MSLTFGSYSYIFIHHVHKKILYCWNSVLYIYNGLCIVVFSLHIHMTHKVSSLIYKCILFPVTFPSGQVPYLLLMKNIIFDFCHFWGVWAQITIFGLWDIFGPKARFWPYGEKWSPNCYWACCKRICNDNRIQVWLRNPCLWFQLSTTIETHG